MRFRRIRCAEEGWVDAESCPHWDRKCPRAKKAKKANHKLRSSPPGFEVLLVQVTGHRYTVGQSIDMERLRGWVRWDTVPNNMRYADCGTCELPWINHQPWYGGEARYVGKLRADRDGETELIPTARSALLRCEACGLTGVA